MAAPSWAANLSAGTVSMAGRRPRLTVRLNASAVWERLNRLNMTQNELARLSGITSGFLSQMMTGKRGPGPGTRRGLLRALEGASFDDLFILEEAHER